MERNLTPSRADEFSPQTHSDRKFLVTASLNTPGSAGRILAALDRIEHLAIKIVEANPALFDSFDYSEFTAKFRVVFPHQSATQPVMGGRLHAEIVSSIDFIAREKTCNMLRLDEEVWLDDRPSTLPERFEMIGNQIDADSPNALNFKISMNPMHQGSVITVRSLDDTAAMAIFSAALGPDMMTLVEEETSRPDSVSPARLLTGCLPRGIMTNLIALRHMEGWKHFAFGTQAQTWYAILPDSAKDPAQLAKDVANAIASIEHFIPYEIDLEPALNYYRQKVLGFIRDRQIQSAWINDLPTEEEI